MRYCAVMAAVAALFAVACSGSTSRSSSPALAAGALQPYDIVLNSDSHPKMGASTIDVSVRQMDGAPVTDADVTAEFVMPVMPTMGKSTTKLVSEGNGRYEGSGSLSMAGSWQVTVIAKRGNAILATKTFNLVAQQ